MTTATLDGWSITTARVQIPAWGCAWADVELDEPAGVTGTVDLAIADLTLRMTVLSGGEYAGRARYRLVAGAGGWGRVIPRKGYGNDAGVKQATVVRDAAEAVGETVAGIDAQTRLGPHYVRPEGPARQVLPPRGWYVRPDGVTQFGSRESAEYTGNGAVTRLDLSAGVVELAVDEIGNLAPGAVVNGQELVDVEISIDASRLAVTGAWDVTGAAPHGQRLNQAIADIVSAMFPRMRFAGVYEYRVATQEGERLSLQAPRAALGMPDLVRVPVRLAPGVRATWMLGSMALVAFVDSDPARPVVIAGDATDSPGWMPLFLAFGNEPTLPIVRVGDPVQAGPFTGAALPNANLRIKAGVA